MARHCVALDVDPVREVPDLVDALLEMSWSCLMICYGNEYVICCHGVCLLVDVVLLEDWSVVDIAGRFDGLSKVIQCWTVSFFRALEALEQLCWFKRRRLEKGLSVLWVFVLAVDVLDLDIVPENFDQSLLDFRLPPC